MSWTLARILGVVGIAVTLVCVALAVKASRRESRVRVVFDVVRIVVSGVAIAVMALVAGISTPGPLLVLGLSGGLLLGLALGWSNQVRVVDGRAVARMSAWGLTAWASGVIVSQVAALAAGAGALEVGQTISWFGVGMLLGMLLGRHPRLAAAMRQTGLAGAGSALFLVLLGPTMLLVREPAVASPALTVVDSAWVLSDTLVNPEGAPTEFVSGTTPGFYGEERFDGTYTRFDVTSSGITTQQRFVDRGWQAYDGTIAITFDQPSARLEPGQQVILAASGSGSGSYEEGQNTWATFQLWVSVLAAGASRGTEVTLAGTSQMAVNINPALGLTSGSVSPSFVVPEPTAGETLVIAAGFWNCAACNVQWLYAAVTGEEPSPGPVTPTAPGEPVSTDPLSTDPLSTDPLSTDPLSTDLVVPPGEGGGLPIPPIAPVDPTTPITAAGAIGVIIAGVIAAAAIGIITIAQAGVLISVLIGDLLGGLAGGGRAPVGVAAPAFPGIADDAATLPPPTRPLPPPTPPRPTGTPQARPTGSPGVRSGGRRTTGSSATSRIFRDPTSITLTGAEATRAIQGGVGTIVEIPTPEGEDQRWDANVEVAPYGPDHRIREGRRGRWGRVIRVETHMEGLVDGRRVDGAVVTVEPFDDIPPPPPPPPPPEPSPYKDPKDLPPPEPEPDPTKTPKDLPPPEPGPEPDGWFM